LPHLLDPLQLGPLTLPNRVIMAPLTRLRGTVDHVPTPIIADYYAQRASAGLIISEGTPVGPLGVGYAQVPGIWSEQQTEQWSHIVDAVHRAGGRIFAQIWHVGRVSHPMFLNGQLPVAPSAIAPAGHVSIVRPELPFVTPHALTLDEIRGIIEQFRQGALNAKAAGFDGVEIHGANGYLLDQFLHAGSNTRTDQYGGSIANRSRLMIEVAEAAASVFGADRVGMHLAPRGDVMSMSDPDPAAIFTYVAQQLGQRKLAFLLAREYEAPGWLGPQLKQAFGGVYMANEKFTRESADAAIERGDCDAVAFGKLFIANPDLPARFAANAALNAPNPATFYTHGPEGYVDYPVLWSISPTGIDCATASKTQIPCGNDKKMSSSACTSSREML
jgi:2,4-dienoyl-CoA reductase-like NADH-dependent reductase (Old Yellow Enzyme family)